MITGINNQKDKYFYIWYGIWLYFAFYSSSYIVSLIFGSIVDIIYSYLILIASIGIFIIYKRKNQSQLKEFFNNVFTKIKKIWIKIKSPFIRLSLSSFALYANIPIILGILAPMFALMIPLYYFSWILFGSGQSLMGWTLYYYIIPQDEIFIWIIAEIIIFCVGSAIFLTGLITMVKEKMKGVTLVQTGIYKYIRHSQNLGIVILLLPFALYVPGFRDPGIRMGDIFSWGIFTFSIGLISFFEEWLLMKQYPEKFLGYYSQTGFYLPNFRYNKKKTPSSSINFYKKGSLLLIYFVVYVILSPMIVQWISGNLMHFR